MLKVGKLSLVHVLSVVLWERARLRVYDLCATSTGVPSFRKMLVILWFRRLEIYGILRYDQSTLGGRQSFFDDSEGASAGLYCPPDIHSSGGGRQTCFGAL